MSLLELLNEKNDVEIISVFDQRFKSFGRVIEGVDFSPLVQYMEEKTEIPEQGNIYVASVEEMEELEVKDIVEGSIYGGMPIQIGYCNGRNSTYNGFEYHKGSEINVAVTDFMLVLGHSYDIDDGHYKNEDATVFFLPKGTAIEMYQTTLHLSPLKVCDEGFKGVVILPKGTNTPLEATKISTDADTKQCGDKEAKLLLQKNKWVISHPDREPLIKQGAFPGIIGENKELFY